MFKVLVTIAMVVCFIAAAATISAFVSMYAFSSNVIFQMVAEEMPDVSREETLAGILSMFFETLADAILLVIAAVIWYLNSARKLRSPPGVPIK